MLRVRIAVVVAAVPLWGCGGSGPDTSIAEAEVGTQRAMCEDFVQAACQEMKVVQAGTPDGTIGEFWMVLLRSERFLNDCGLWESDPDAYAESVYSDFIAEGGDAYVDKGYATYHANRYMEYRCAK